MVDRKVLKIFLIVNLYGLIYLQSISKITMQVRSNGITKWMKIVMIISSCKKTQNDHLHL
jgi:hypothetical protein